MYRVPPHSRRRFGAALVLGLATAVTAAACTGTGDPGDASGGTRSRTQGGCVEVVDEATGKPTGRCLPLAPDRARVDRAPPEFSHPTVITNPLHPTRTLTQTVYGGQADGKPFRAEVTRMPQTTTITWRGERIEALESQYAAYSGGRITEVALDWFAQADDGSVWYLGEDVRNYEHGVVADRSGSWKAGKTGPGAMIMPPDPRRGDVYRPENVPGVVFEQVRVTAVGKQVQGPYEPVKGAITVRELHLDGGRETKVFAPGYGEFSTGGSGGDREKVALAAPTDARRAPAPRSLPALDHASRAGAEAAAGHSAPEARAAADTLRSRWQAYRSADRVPALLERQMSRDIATLQGVAHVPGSAAARAAGLRVLQNSLDLRLRYEPVPSVDRERLELWARQAVADAAAGDAAGVAGDVTSLEITVDRLRDRGGGPSGLAERISALRAAAAAGDVPAAGEAANALLRVLDSVPPP